jgi:hypothetical protein
LAATFWLGNLWLAPTSWLGFMRVVSLGGLVYGLELVVYLLIAERPDNMTSSEWTVSLLLRLQNRNQ